MLSELDKLFTASPGGFCFIEYTPTLSPTFLFIHFISNFTRNGRQILFCSLHTSKELLRITMGKMAQRVDPVKFHFIPLNSFLNDSLLLDVSDILERIFLQIQARLQSEAEEPLLVILDDLFFLSLFPDFPVSKLFQFIQRIRRELPEHSLVLVATGGDCTKLRPFLPSLCNLHIQMSPIGNGFGKNITGKLEIFQSEPNLDSQPQRTELHYFCGQRSAKTFVPGSAQMLM